MESASIFNLHPLFEDVQMKQVFTDGKTFVDCIPQQSGEKINKEYEEQKNEQGFQIRDFVMEHFEMPVPKSSDYVSDPDQSVEQHIEELWNILTRKPDTHKGSLIPLPYPYIVPGGRFGEIYYWDSYFTLLGLAASGKTDLLENMVDNFSYLIDTIGYIPNGNRTYYIGRSQPPFYSLMVRLLAEVKGNAVLIRYLPQLEKEYLFWMNGEEQLSAEEMALHHIVKMKDGELLNRYWDENNTPRPEAYREDVELSQQSSQEAGQLYRNLRAGAASGWDYSQRWFKEAGDFGSIHTTDIIPVDLNCLLFHLEELIGEIYNIKGDAVKTATYQTKASGRKAAIQKYCWNPVQQFYTDYDISAGRQRETLTLAASFPLFFKLATQQQANAVASTIKEKFLKPGGLVTTLLTTGQQWDAPNGWAPLQWMAIIGLENYGYHELVKEISQRWIKLNKEVFQRTGKLMEKYNVVDTHLEAGGGEYPGQDGFGWTNGVLLALLRKY